jgi:hypothetical protein
MPFSSLLPIRIGKIPRRWKQRGVFMPGKEGFVQVFSVGIQEGFFAFSSDIKPEVSLSLLLWEKP